MRDFQSPGRSAVFAANGMCATSHPLAAQVAIDTLKRGGNAIDAAIAGAVLLGICEPQMTGIGGDCFVLFTKPGSNDVLALNGSGRAPAAASAERLRAMGHHTVPKTGAEAVTIPGAIDAFCRLSTDHGALGLDAILQPAIDYAEQGVPVAPRVAFDWHKGEAALKGAARDHYLNAGAKLKTGDIFRSPGQAKVLRKIARDGRNAFYTGEVADDMLRALNADGGIHDASDFAAMHSDYTCPIAGEYQGTTLLEHPPNGQGATAILILNMMKHFNISSMDPLGAERIHLEAEITKLAYDARNRFVADPDHMHRLDHLLSPDTAQNLAGLINMRQAMPSASALSEQVHRDTIYITVVDRDRMVVSLIYSIFSGFGSGLASEKYGILLHNRGSGFNLTPGHPNELGPAKRPMHTIIPGILAENGQVTMPFGVMGGAYQACGHARFMSNMLDFGMDPQSAIDAPRAFTDAGELRVERGYCDTVRRALSEMGHNVVIPDEAIGGAQAINIQDSGILQGASDPRKDGCALGY